MKTTSLEGILACALILGVSGGAFAFYRPGVLKEAAPLTNTPGDVSPLSFSSQDGVPEGFWKMEENVFLRHFERGEGRPVLVIHGGPGIPPREPWKGLETLSGSHRFVYYHQRGCGKSTRPFDRFDSTNFYGNMQTLVSALGMSAQLADIERIRRILGEERLTLIGHSYGGFMAALYAVEFPDRVERMVLVSPADTLAMPPLHGGLVTLGEFLDERGKKEYASFLARYFDYGSLFRRSEGELASLNADFGRFYVEALRAKGVEASRAEVDVRDIGGWSVHAIYLSLGQSYDFRDNMKEVGVPVLVVHGAKDVQPEEASRQYAGLIPGGRFAVIDGASHFAFDETPGDFAALLFEFWK
jgi:proline iminopeptidase